MRFSRQEHWRGLPCPPPGDLPDPGIEPASLMSSALAVEKEMASHSSSFLEDPKDGGAWWASVYGVAQSRTQLKRLSSSSSSSSKGHYISLWLSGKEFACNAGDAEDMGSIPGSGRSPGGGHGNPRQYSCLENPMDRGAWWAAVHRVTKSRT